jgi:hypothetical protein
MPRAYEAPRTSPTRAVEFPSPCDGSEWNPGRSVFGGLVQVRISGPSEGMQSLPPLPKRVRPSKRFV